MRPLGHLLDLIGCALHLGLAPLEVVTQQVELADFQQVGLPRANVQELGESSEPAEPLSFEAQPRPR